MSAGDKGRTPIAKYASVMITWLIRHSAFPSQRYRVNFELLGDGSEDEDEFYDSGQSRHALQQ